MMTDRLLRLSEVMAYTGFGRSTIYRMMQSGDFPMSVQRSPGTVGWWQAEIDQWSENRPRSKRASERAPEK